mmetsp:Transcript_76558/g.112150  ORF Transcript_76558/g.112150 Transcript_76558/m.112150 type:complete len:93 (-) Transcript_76558:427-705(-)
MVPLKAHQRCDQTAPFTLSPEVYEKHTPVKDLLQCIDLSHDRFIAITMDIDWAFPLFVWYECVCISSLGFKGGAFKKTNITTTWRKCTAEEK